VSGALTRLAGVFVEPAAATGGVAPSRVAVLGRADEARAIAAGVALSLDGVPVVAGWRAGRAARAAATVGARRVAARLARRGFDAVARGRIAWAALPDAAEAAAGAARRLDGALVDEPMVLALGGARAAALEPLLADMEAVVVAAEPGSALARVAVAARPGVIALSPPAGLERWLALRGWGGAREVVA
jgi:hypothetical protein